MRSKRNQRAYFVLKLHYFRDSSSAYQVSWSNKARHRLSVHCKIDVRQWPLASWSLSNRTCRKRNIQELWWSPIRHKDAYFHGLAGPVQRWRDFPRDSVGSQDEQKDEQDLRVPCLRRTSAQNNLLVPGYANWKSCREERGEQEGISHHRHVVADIWSLHPEALLGSVPQDARVHAQVLWIPRLRSAAVQ